MKKTFFIFALVIYCSSVFSSEGYLYFSNFLGHVHKNPVRESASQTIVQCSHAVKMLKVKKEIPGWKYVQVGDDKGFIQSHFLNKKRPDCFQQKYPQFYNSLNLDLSEMYYWGKLYDHYVIEKSKVK